MPRQGRYLKGNRSTRIPSNLVFFDTESYSEPIPWNPAKKRLVLRCWYAIRVRLEGLKATRRKEQYGTTPEEFWQWLSEVSDGQRDTWCFAHNIGFDLTQLEFWSKLDNGTFCTTVSGNGTDIGDDNGESRRKGKLCLDGCPTYIVVRQNQKWIRFVDTLNYWRKSLFSIGESIGLSKLEMPAHGGGVDDWKAYCRRDTEIVEFAVTELLREWKREDSGVFQMTGPSLAMTNFRHKCKVRKGDGDNLDIICEPGSKRHEAERLSYFGGRTTCYYVGTINRRVYHIDCNSLYPFVMQDNLFPRRFTRFQYGMSTDELNNAMRVYGAVAQCLINARHDSFPVWIDGKQHHCTGRYWTTLCGPELQRAIDTESVHRVGLCQFYSVAPLFNEWVSYWYDRKSMADANGPGGLAEREFCKLILNSLSGKWAQRGRGWRDIPGEIPLKRWGGYAERIDGELVKRRGIAGLTQQLIEDDEHEPPHSFPAISAFITSYAREYMRSIIAQLPHRSVYYSAVDSLIVNENGLHYLERAQLLSPSEIGKFKVLGSYQKCTIHGPNWYELDGKITATGSYGKMVNAKQACSTVDTFEQLTSLIATGPRSDVTVTTVVPHVPTPDHRGIIQPDGWWTPLRWCPEHEFTDRPNRLPYHREYSLDNQADHTVLAEQL